MVRTVRVRRYSVLCPDFIEWLYQPTVFPSPPDRIGVHKYIQQSGTILLYLVNAVIVVLTVTFVSGMGRVAMCALVATPCAPFQFLSVLCRYGDIIAQHRNIYVLGIYETILHVLWTYSAVPVAMSCYLDVHICHT